MHVILSNLNMILLLRAFFREWIEKTNTQIAYHNTGPKNTWRLILGQTSRKATVLIISTHKIKCMDLPPPFPSWPSGPTFGSVGPVFPLPSWSAGRARPATAEPHTARPRAAPRLQTQPEQHRNKHRSRSVSLRWSSVSTCWPTVASLLYASTTVRHQTHEQEFFFNLQVTGKLHNKSNKNKQTIQSTYCA